MNDARLYGAVAEELERGLVRKDLWARALIDSDGNKDDAHERYVMLCAELLAHELDGIPAEPEGEAAPDRAADVVHAAEAVRAADALPEPALEPVPEGESLKAATPEEPLREPAAAAPTSAASVSPKWTPYQPGLERVTKLTLILGGVALVGALDLAIAGFEGPGLGLGIAGLVLLGLGLLRVSKSNHYRGPIR